MSTYLSREPLIIEPPEPLPGRKRGRRSSPVGWRWIDRLAFLFAWSAGILLCLISAAIVIYMAVRGIEYLRPGLLFERPSVGLSQSESGGFLDPMIGSGILTLLGLLFSVPLAVASAFWIVEYGRPRWVARIVESSIEIVAGTPDIVLAIFGLAIFQLGIFAPLSFQASGAGVFGRSFLIAGLMMSLIAIPPIFAATRDGLQAVPGSMREASYALGKTRISTIRRVLLPNVRSNIATGVTLGVSRIIGDTAIVLLLLGETLHIETQGSAPILSVLRGTGSTLTSYVYDNSPAGEGGAPQKAYAAAFVLLLLVLVLNLAVDVIGRRHARSTGAGTAARL